MSVNCGAPGADYLAAPLFQGIEPAALAREINEDMCCEYESGEYLLRKGQAQRALLVLLSGTVQIIGRDAKDREQQIADRSVGEIVGEQSIIDRATATADAKATDRVTALRIPSDAVDRLIDTQPRFARNLLEILSGKLREATDDRVRHRLEQRLLFAHFSSHVSRQFVSELLRRGEDAGAARTVEAIVMFTDLRDFTRISDSLACPEQIAADLAPYFASVVDVVHESNGIVDKFIGDAVMAIWGHPALAKTTADQVMDAVLEMRRRTSPLRFGGEPIRIGVGLDAGTVFMGNVGSEEKRSFTVFGSAVNFAARYEGANRGDEGQGYVVTVGPTFYERLGREHKGILVAREGVRIKGAPGDRQTVFSLKED